MAAMLQKDAMKLLLCSLALSFAMEGVFFALFPALARKCMEEALKMGDQPLRAMGAGALCAAIALALLSRLFS